MDIEFFYITTLAVDAVDTLSRCFFQCVCHQQSERLMHVGVHVVHLCPRCIGIHLGFFLGVLGVTSLIGDGGSFRPLLLTAAVMLGLGTGVHWLLEAEWAVQSDVVMRTVTGSLSGIGGAVLFATYRRYIRAELHLSCRARIVPGFLLLVGATSFTADTELRYVVIVGISMIAVLANACMIFSTILYVIVSRFFLTINITKHGGSL